MPDRITGTSILGQTEYRGIFQLWFQGTKHTGERKQCWIYIAEHPPTPPAVIPPAIGDRQVWKFRRVSCGLIACQPSVNWISWGFHNPFDWETLAYQCLQMDAPASEIHYALNWQDLQGRRLTDEECTAYRDDLIARGIIIPA